MSKFDFKLPDIGEGVMEGEIVKWLVGPGDAVAEDQPMVEVMTDKATVTITSPKRGRVLELGGGEGAVIAVHSTLVVLDTQDGPGAASVRSPEPAAEPAATAVGDIKETLPGTGLSRSAPATPRGPAPAPPGPASKASSARGSYFNDKPLATPATRKLARDLGVDLHRVEPSGKGGRVSKDDVRRLAAGEALAGSAFGGAASGEPFSSVPTEGRPPVVVAPTAGDTRTPLRGVRKRIFENMARSKHTAAHFTFVEECDVTTLKALRERLKPRAAEAGVKLTFLPFIVKAVVAALKKHPSLNSAFDESTSEIVERHVYNVGIASATEAGLVVPVVHGADKLSLLEIAREIDRLGEATKTGRMSPDDLRGSTFTITSLGKFGGLFATPILNTPEVGILGIHQMKQKPVVKDGAIVIGDVMLLSLSFDHRIIDGHIGAAFAYEIIGYLEEPDALWLELR
jgi:pyruvate dehydrogenase E2 component (dihydrolipoamide acetyltransferase)